MVNTKKRKTIELVVKQFDVSAEVKAAMLRNDAVGAIGALLQGLLLLSKNDGELAKEVQKLDRRMRGIENMEE